MGTRAALYKKSRWGGGVGAKEGENHPAVLRGRGGSLPPRSHVLKPALGGWRPAPSRSRKGGLLRKAAGQLAGVGGTPGWTPSAPGHGVS